MRQIVNLEILSEKKFNIETICVCSPIALGNVGVSWDLHNAVHMSSQSTLLSKLL